VVRQPQFPRLLRGDPNARQREFLRERQTDLQRPGQRAAVGRDESDLHVRVGEVRGLGHLFDEDNHLYETPEALT
jgi:hypothetical protein